MERADEQAAIRNRSGYASVVGHFARARGADTGAEMTFEADKISEQVLDDNKGLLERLSKHDTEPMAAADAALKELLRKPETPAERVVRLLNDSIAAYNSLSDAERGCIEKTHTDSGWYKPSALFSDRYRVRPATFEPLTLPDSGYRVETLPDNKLKVGCRVFEVDATVEALQHLLRDGFAASSISLTEIHCRRVGVFVGAEHITWADADLLLARLEAHLGAKGG